jgi:PTS system beta-glucosides-specific IIC component
MNYEDTAKLILKKIGGKENIIRITHCATRLRFQLRNENIAETEEIKTISGVVAIISQGGQYQIVIGSEVASVYKSLIELTAAPNSI